MVIVSLPLFVASASVSAVWLFSTFMSFGFSVSVATMLPQLGKTWRIYGSVVITTTRRTRFKLYLKLVILYCKLIHNFDFYCFQAKGNTVSRVFKMNLTVLLNYWPIVLKNQIFPNRNLLRQQYNGHSWIKHFCIFILQGFAMRNYSNTNILFSTNVFSI